MVKNYAEAYVTFIDSLSAVRGYACGESDGDFKDSLSKSKGLHRKAHELRKEIREFYRTVIREDIKELREQAKESNSDKLDAPSS